ncbi:hypothetical protein SSX86_023704 [Deinandra increscens subsp. villosa]|uniref:Fe2OG dioxygenase domain-containing protein n=1 Tax=Deinandra increscens subsp. villosa TaxID=3103831 RepID=A0AAP0GTU1_9ASTR
MKQFGDKSQKDDDNRILNHPIFDYSSFIHVASNVNNLKIPGYNRQGNRCASGKSGIRIKRTVQKFKAKIDGSLDSSRAKRLNHHVLDESSVTGESLVKDVASDVKDLKLKPCLCDDDCEAEKIKQFGDKSQKDDDNRRLNYHVFDKSSVTGESCVKDVASDVKNLNLKPCLFNDGIDAEKIKQFGDISQKYDDNGRLNHHVFDKSSVTGESCVKDVASDVKNLNLKSCLRNDDTFEKIEQFGDKSRKDGDNGRLSHHVLNKSSVIRESVIKDVASDVKNLVKDVAFDIDGSLDSSCAKSDKSSVTGESVFIHPASDPRNLRLEPISFGDKSQKDNDNERISHHVFDICPKKVCSAIKLKTPLHVKNKERRNQMKQATSGDNMKILRSGMVLMKGYISSNDQISIVKTCRELGIGDGGFYQPGYSRSFDNSKPPGIPEKFHDLVKKAIQDSNEFIRGNAGSSDERKVIPSMSPDVCIVRFYSKSGRLGLHQDKDESEMSLRKGLPVVSFSIGDSAEFVYGETRSVDDADKVILESGDVLIYGGKSRLIYHGVTSIIPDTAPIPLMEATDMLPGRLNLTFRMF